MKKLKILTSIIIVISCVLILSSCKYKYIFKHYNEINEDIPDNLTSSASMAEYARNIVEKDCGKEFNVGSVYMILDSELKGEVEVILVEKKQKKPLLVYVDFDTKNNKLLSFKYVSWHSKLDPGVINIHNWGIDYAEAIEISKELHSKTDGFRYDDVIIRTDNSHPFEDEDWEVWSVAFRDYQSKKNYDTRIEPYIGEILNHGIWKWVG